MAKDGTYSSGQMARAFRVNKKTLFRWEERDEIPPVTRDWRHHRQYTEEHIAAIQAKTGIEPDRKVLRRD